MISRTKTQFNNKICSNQWIQQLTWKHDIHLNTNVTIAEQQSKQRNHHKTEKTVLVNYSNLHLNILNTYKKDLGNSKCNQLVYRKHSCRACWPRRACWKVGAKSTGSTRDAALHHVVQVRRRCHNQLWDSLVIVKIQKNSFFHAEREWWGWLGLT